MSFNREQDQHDDLIRAIYHLSHIVEKGFKLMADVEAQAIADLTAAVTAVGDAITAEIAALQAALSTAGVDHSPQIEASVTKLNDLTNQLKSSLPAPAPAPAPAPTPAP